MNNTTDNNNNNNKKYIQIEEPKDDYDRVKLSYVVEFPMCFQHIQDEIECERAYRYAPGVSGPKCDAFQNQMNYCILSSFCPKESIALVDCLGGKIPDRNPMPKRCLPHWNLFDQCLIKKTQDFENNKHQPPPSNTKVYRVVNKEDDDSTESNKNESSNSNNNNK
eukprot:gene9956-12208_t